MGETRERGPFGYASLGETRGQGMIGYVILGEQTIRTFKVTLGVCGVGHESPCQCWNDGKINLFCDLNVQVD